MSQTTTFGYDNQGNVLDHRPAVTRAYQSYDAAEPPVTGSPTPRCISSSVTYDATTARWP